jgi:N utilization substance protein B
MYQIECGTIPKDAICDFFERFSKSENEKQFTLQLVLETNKNKNEIDKKISLHSLKWRLERMSMVDRNILRLATYELNYNKEPHKVILNEWIEIAKIFSTENSARFVNGVLNSML